MFQGFIKQIWTHSKTMSISGIKHANYSHSLHFDVEWTFAVAKQMGGFVSADIWSFISTLPELTGCMRKMISCDLINPLWCCLKQLALHTY